MIDHDECVRRARDLAPLLAEEAGEAERIRQPVDRVIEAIADARLFELMVPRAYGGLELDLDTFLEVGLALAEGDASMAWTTLFYIEHNWMLCQFPEAFQRKLFADRSFVLAPAMVAATGTARPEGDGFRIDGRWSWATGIMHADWVLPAARLEVDGAFDVRFFALERNQVEVEDVWQMQGMCGTGSNDVIVRDLYVPAERTTSVIEMSNGVAPGAKLHNGALYRTPMLGILVPTAAIPAIGQAKAAVRHFGTDLATRTLPMIGTPRPSGRRSSNVMAPRTSRRGRPNRSCARGSSPSCVSATARPSRIGSAIGRSSVSPSNVRSARFAGSPRGAARAPITCPIPSNAPAGTSRRSLPMSCSTRRCPRRCTGGCCSARHPGWGSSESVTRALIPA